MADKLNMALPVKWSDDVAFPPTATILDDSQIVGLQSGGNVKWDFSVIQDTILTPISGGFLEVYVDSFAGVNAGGRGSAVAPYQSISFALSEITNNSASIPYLIHAFGVFNDAAWILKPYIYYDFHNGSYSIANVVRLDAEWTAGGIVSVKNLQALTMPAGLSFDFRATNSPMAVIQFQNCITTQNSLIEMIGNPSGTNIFIIDRMFGFATESSLRLINCDGGISGSVFQNLTLTNTFFNVEACQAFGNTLFQDGTIFATSTHFDGPTTFFADLSTLQVSNTGAFFLDTLTIDGASATLNTDVLSVTPIYTNGATSSNVTINARQALSAGVGIDYNSTTGVISATGTAGVDLQLAYTNGPNANTNVVNGRPVTWTSTTEVIRAPSMFLSEANSLVNPLNGGTGWLSDAGRPFWNIGTPVVPNIQQGAYISDINGIGLTPAFGEMYFTANVVRTVIVTPGVPVKVNATYNTGALSNFTQANGTLTYIGEATIPFDSSCVASATMTLTTDTIELFIYKNGVAVTSSIIAYDLDGVSPSLKATPVQAIIESLSTNDYLEIFIANLTSTNGPTVNSLNFSVKSIGGSSTVLNQVVILWDGSTNPVAVTAGTGIDITGGVITNTSVSSETFQDVYNNSTPANMNIVSGNPFTLTSSDEGFRTVSVTNADLPSFVSPLNGLMVWLNDDNRLALNTGSPSSPMWSEVAYISDSPGLATLQTAYNNGDGIITYAVPNKPVTLQSDVGSTIPQLNLYQRDISGVDPIGMIQNFSKNTSGAQINYADIETFILSSATNNESAQVNFNAQNNGLQRTYLSYNGLLNQLTWDAQNTIVTNRMQVGPSMSGVNYTLGASTVPTTNYVSAAGYQLMWQAFNGTNIVVANSFAIGDTIELSITGVLNVDLFAAPPDQGSQFNIQFQSVFNVFSSKIFTGPPGTRTGQWALKLKITRTGTSTVNASASGWYSNAGANLQPIIFDITPNLPYLANQDTFLQILYANQTATVTSPFVFNFVATNLDIVQKT